MDKAQFDKLVIDTDQKFSGVTGVLRMLSPEKSTDLECSIWWLLHSSKLKSYLNAPILKRAWCHRFGIERNSSLEQINAVNSRYQSKFTQSLLDAGLLFSNYVKEKGLNILPVLKQIDGYAVYSIEQLQKVRNQTFLFLRRKDVEKCIVIESQTKVYNFSTYADGIARLVINGHLYENHVLQAEKLKELFECIGDTQENLRSFIKTLMVRTVVYNPLEPMVTYPDEVKYRDIQTVLELFYPSNLVSMGMSFVASGTSSFDIIDFLESSKHAHDAVYSLPELI